MHPTIKTFSLIIFLLCTASCWPRYKEPDFFKGGYQSVQLGPNKFKIDYKSGIFTAQNSIFEQDRICMMRAANVTLENGFKYFTLYSEPSVEYVASISNSISKPISRAIYIKCYNEQNESTNLINAENFLKFNKI